MSGAAPTIKPMLSGSLASTPTALAGTPLARKPMAGPEARPKSTELAPIPCCNLASPAKMTVSTSRSCFAQMPSAAPISTGAKANGWLTDLPTRTLSPAAPAGGAPTASVASKEHTSELQSPKDLVCRLLVTGVQTCALDRKSTRLNSSHKKISYAVFCLKKELLHSAALLLEELQRQAIRGRRSKLRT